MYRLVDDQSGFLSQAGLTQDDPQQLLMALRGLTQTGETRVQKSNGMEHSTRRVGSLERVDGLELGGVPTAHPPVRGLHQDL